jgi:hypothetical protein
MGFLQYIESKTKADSPTLLRSSTSSGGGVASGATVPSGILTSKQTTTLNQLVDNARQDPDISTFGVVRDAYNDIQNAAAVGTGVGDLTLLRKFAKLTDPTTGVREEEYRTMQNAIGAVTALGVKVSKGWWNGKQLTPEGRAAFTDMARKIYESKLNYYQQKVNFVQNQAKATGIDPNLVILPLTENVSNQANITSGNTEDPAGIR